MTEQLVINLGFKLVKHYDHDEWETFRYKKGVISVEFTYKLGLKELETVDVTIEEIVGKEMSFYSLYMLDTYLNH